MTAFPLTARPRAFRGAEARLVLKTSEPSEVGLPSWRLPRLEVEKADDDDEGEARFSSLCLVSCWRITATGGRAFSSLGVVMVGRVEAELSLDRALELEDDNALDLRALGPGGRFEGVAWVVVERVGAFELSPILSLRGVFTRNESSTAFT